MSQTGSRRLAVRGVVHFIVAIAFALSAGATNAQSDPLPSWNEGAAKRSVTEFVARLTMQGGADFVPVEPRIATFANGCPLWCGQPLRTQLAFAFDRIKAMAPAHPEWKTKQPFKALLDEDMRANGSQTFIVSGGGVEIVRPWTEEVYGIPPERVVGSSGVLRFQMGNDGEPTLVKLARNESVDDGPGEPVGINRFIGRRPILAFGNSDGDLQMLQWTVAGGGARFAGLLHHTDAEREYVYDRQSKVGKLDGAMDEADAKDWTVVDMKRDWKTVFPPEGKPQ
jgi:haloacid dehalogenase-like hydrolase